MFQILLCVAALFLVSCGGEGGSGASVTIQQPPGTTICDVEVNEETGAAVNVFCDADGNVVGEGSIDSGNSTNTPSNSNNNNTTS